MMSAFRRLEELSKEEILDEDTKKQRESEMKLISESIKKNPLLAKELEARRKAEEERKKLESAGGEEDQLRYRLEKLKKEEEEKREKERREAEMLRKKKMQESKGDMELIRASTKSNPFLAQDKERKAKEEEDRRRILEKYKK